MDGMSSSAMADQRVYAQPTEPTDTRDGVMWVDTSKDSRPVFVYSTDASGFEPVSPENITVSDTAPDSPTLGDGWIDTSEDPPVLNLYNRSNWVPQAKEADLYSDSDAKSATRSMMASGSVSADDIEYTVLSWSQEVDGSRLCISPADPANGDMVVIYEPNSPVTAQQYENESYEHEFEVFRIR